MRFGLLLASPLAVTTSPIALAAPSGAGMSALPTRPDDPAAKIVKGKGEGRADDTAAIQQALDTTRDKTGHGLVFLPSGRYRITRTLTLLDGQRVVGANVTGAPDISQFPQLLIDRVDVVTGGASASYGSDAVGGVVNFITNKRFTGVKGNVQGGISTYGDDESVLVQLAASASFADDRLHLIVSGEYALEEWIGPGGFGEDAPAGRDWYTTATIVNRGVTNDGRPQFNYREHAQAYQYTLHCLINNGPLQGPRSTATDSRSRSNTAPAACRRATTPATSRAATSVSASAATCRATSGSAPR